MGEPSGIGTRLRGRDVTRLVQALDPNQLQVQYDYVDASVSTSKAKKAPAYAATDIRVRAYYYAFGEPLEDLARRIAALQDCRATEVITGDPDLRPQVVAFFRPGGAPSTPGPARVAQLTDTVCFTLQLPVSTEEWIDELLEREDGVTVERTAEMLNVYYEVGGNCNAIVSAGAFFEAIRYPLEEGGVDPMEFTLLAAPKPAGKAAA